MTPEIEGWETDPTATRQVRLLLRDRVFPILRAEHPAIERRDVLIALLRAVVARMARARGLDAPAMPPLAVAVDPAALNAINWAAVEVTLPGALYADLMDERHAQGSYFTPRALADQVVRWTLESFHSEPAAILDPAMGAGHFLIAAADFLAGPGADPARRWRIARLLHGADRDPLAVELARAGLWLWAALPGTSSDALSGSLRCGDSLLDDLWPDHPGGFDALVGNPPYASVFTRALVDAPERRAALTARYETAARSFDLAVLFVERALRLTREGGRCGLVLPNKLLAADYARDLRRWLADRATVEVIADTSQAGDFDAGVYPVVCVFRQGMPDPSAPLAITRHHDGVPALLRHARQSDLRGAPGDVWSAVLDPDWESLRQWWQGDVIPLGEVAELAAGLTVGEAYDLRDQVFDCPPGPLPGGFFPLITSGLIQRHATTWGVTRAPYLKRTFRRPVIAGHALPPRRRDQAARPKLIAAGLGLEPRLVYDPGTMQASVGTIIIFDSASPLAALGALLNARLAARLYRALFGGLALNGGYLRFGKRELTLLPIPRLPADDPQVARLAELGVARARASGAASVTLDAEIDTLVEALYGLGGG